jgi:hypothetical protein
MLRVLQPVPEGSVLWASEPGARRCYEGLHIPPTPSLEIRGFCHGERRREARKEVTVVLAVGHTLRAHEALSRSDALSGFLEVVHRLFEYGVFDGHERSIRISSVVRSPHYSAFSCEQGF